MAPPRTIKSYPGLLARHLAVIATLAQGLSLRDGRKLIAAELPVLGSSADVNATIAALRDVLPGSADGREISPIVPHIIGQAAIMTWLGDGGGLPLLKLKSDFTGCWRQNWGDKDFRLRLWQATRRAMKLPAVCSGSWLSQHPTRYPFVACPLARPATWFVLAYLQLTARKSDKKYYTEATMRVSVHTYARTLQNWFEGASDCHPHFRAS
jgi:hypothetical protein